MNKKIEKKTADAILQEPMEVTVGTKKYEVAPPCGATLIMVSRFICDMPELDFLGSRLNETLAFAKDCDPMYKVVATLIMGAKAIRDERKKRNFWHKKDEKFNALVEELKYECSNKEVFDIASDILSGHMGISDFFALSASLREISLIQRTRDAETTASGQ